MDDDIDDFNRAALRLLDIPIRDEKEYKQWEQYLTRWTCPEVQTPQEIIDKILDCMVDFKKRECN